jgi:RHS repeat-associated protein
MVTLRHWCGEEELCLISSTSEIRYLLSGGKTYMEVDPTSGAKTKYIYAGDEKIAMIDNNGAVHYYVKDHLGSTRFMAKENGTVDAMYMRYTSYGNTKSELVSRIQDYKFTGKPLDAEAGLNLYYFGARYYNPAIGRWLSLDPMRANFLSISAYVYCNGNPLKLIDPDGKYWILETSGIRTKTMTVRERIESAPLDSRQKTVLARTLEGHLDDKISINLPDYRISWSTINHAILKMVPFLGPLRASFDEPTENTGKLWASAIADCLIVIINMQILSDLYFDFQVLSLLKELANELDDPELVAIFHEIYGPFPMTFPHLMVQS